MNEKQKGTGCLGWIFVLASATALGLLLMRVLDYLRNLP